MVDTGPEPSSFFQVAFEELLDSIFRSLTTLKSSTGTFAWRTRGWTCRKVGNKAEIRARRHLEPGAPVIFGHSDQEHWQKMGLEPKAWSLGMKRHMAAVSRHQELSGNVAIELSCGEIIAHFDDDDLYAPCYLSTMQDAKHREGQCDVGAAREASFQADARRCAIVDHRTVVLWFLASEVA